MKVPAWWLLALAGTFIAFDLYQEPWRIPPFLFFCLVFFFIVFIPWASFKDEL
jgi:hypothetical protein